MAVNLPKPSQTDELKPWECQEGETPHAYEIFRAYIDLGPQRTLEKLGAKLNIAAGTLARWSYQNKWQDRLRAWLNHEMQRLADMKAEYRIKLAPNIVENSTVMTNTGYNRLKMLGSERLQDDDPGLPEKFIELKKELDVKDVARLMGTGHDILFEFLGKESDKPPTQTEIVINFNTQTDEEIEQERAGAPDEGQD